MVLSRRHLQVRRSQDVLYYPLSVSAKQATQWDLERRASAIPPTHQRRRVGKLRSQIFQAAIVVASLAFNRHGENAVVGLSLGNKLFTELLDSL
jgi:hypothetical protein